MSSIEYLNEEDLVELLKHAITQMRDEEYRQERIGYANAALEVVDFLYKKSNPEPETLTPTIKEYSKEQYPTLDHVEDAICDNAGAYDEDSDDWDGYEEIFIYDGKTYKALLEHDGTYMEYGMKGMEVTIKGITE